MHKGTLNIVRFKVAQGHITSSPNGEWVRTEDVYDALDHCDDEDSGEVLERVQTFMAYLSAR